MHFLNKVKELRFRHIYMVIGTILVTLMWFITDPDLNIVDSMSYGASTVATLLLLLKSILYVSVLHVSRKALFDYIDLMAVYNKAIQNPTGAGYAMMSISVAMVAIAITIFAATSN